MSTAGQWSYVAAVVGFTLAALVWDLRQRRIPNWLNVSALLLGICWHILFGNRSSLTDAGTAFAFGFGTFLILWLIGGGGGGDAKLMGALAVWLGFKSTVSVMILTAVMLAVFSLILAVSNRVRTMTVTQIPPTPKRRKTVPFAVPASLATWAVLGLHGLRMHTGI